MRKAIWAGGALAVACMLCALLAPSDWNILLILALPLVTLGEGLRALSLSGTVGNVAAIVLYVTVSLAPAGYALLRRRSSAKWTLYAVSAYLLFLLYMLVNPALIAGLFAPELASMPKEITTATLCAPLWLLIVARTALVWVARPTQRAMRGLLLSLSGLLIVSVCYADVRTLAASVPLGAADACAAVARFLASAVPACLLLSLVPMLWRLTASDPKRPFSEQNACEIDRMAARSRLALKASVGTALLSAALTLLLARYMRNVDLSVSLPLDMLALTLALALLSRWMKAACALQTSDDLMI